MELSAVEWLVRKLSYGQNIKMNWVTQQYIEQARQLEKLLQSQAIQDALTTMVKTNPES
jgi:hypothetical protein